MWKKICYIYRFLLLWVVIGYVLVKLHAGIYLEIKEKNFSLNISKIQQDL